MNKKRTYINWHGKWGVRFTEEIVLTHSNGSLVKLENQAWLKLVLLFVFLLLNTNQQSLQRKNEPPNVPCPALQQKLRFWLV